MGSSGAKGGSTAGYYAPVDHVDAFGTAVTTSPPSGPATIDGVAVTTGDRVLLTYQSHGIDDGIWIANTSGLWIRPSDYAIGSIVKDGSLFLVNSGNFQSAYLWLSQWMIQGAITVGIDTPNFSCVNAGAAISILPQASSNPILYTNSIIRTPGINTASHVNVSNPAVTSGVAFEPSATTDSTVYFQINASAAGSYTLTIGPLGTENTIASGVAMVVGSDALVTLRVPATWQVVITLTTVTLASTTVVTG